MSFIQTYFLRVYAIERSKQGQDDRAAHHEALFQTRFLLFLPAVGLGSAAIVVVGRWSSSSLAILNEYRAFITLAAIAGLALTSFVLVGRAIRKIDNVPKMAETYSGPRDRVIPHVQFWCTLLLSLSLPFLVAAV